MSQKPKAFGGAVLKDIPTPPEPKQPARENPIITELRKARLAKAAHRPTILSKRSRK